MLTDGRERSATVSVHSSSRPLSLSVYLALLLHMRCMSTYIYMHTYIYICLLIGTSPSPRHASRTGAGGGDNATSVFLFIYPRCIAACCCHVLPPTLPCHVGQSIVPCARHLPTNSRLATNSRPWLRYCRPRPERNELMTPPKTFFWYFTHHALHVASRDAPRVVARPHRSAQSRAGEVGGPHTFICLFVCPKVALFRPSARKGS